MSNDEIFGIINFINSLSFSEFELDTGEIKIRIQRETTNSKTKTSSKSSVVLPAGGQNRQVSGDSLAAPISGVFYQASAPGEKPFVSVGDSVKKGDTLCILEAMKMMNEVKSDRDGVIQEILVTDGNPVEEKDILFVFRGA
ncbi:MAG: biotin/lipoyl-containing protein [Eubacteriales bacterium]